jgi:hypothetical protein
MSVLPSLETFWTIMSTRTPASASGRKTRAAIPGRSGTPKIVTFASELSWAMPEMIACSIASSLSIHVPSSPEKEERTWRRTRWLRASSTARSMRTFDPQADSSSISS